MIIDQLPNAPPLQNPSWTCNHRRPNENSPPGEGGLLK